MYNAEEVINLLKNFRVYEFEDVDEDFGKYLINEKNPERIEELLEEYREGFEEGLYDGDLMDFLEFLEEKGYSIIALDTDYCIYF